MNRMLAGGLGWSLAWLAATAVAGEGPRPAVIARSDNGAAAGVSLGRPLVLPTAAQSQATGVFPAGFAESAPRVVRANGSEPTCFAAPEPLNLENFNLSPPGKGSEFATGSLLAPAGGSNFGGEPAPVVVPPTAPAPVRSTVVPDPGCGLGCASGDVVCCDPCVDCCDCGVGLHRLYLRAEYLLWWIRAPGYPVLATTGSVASQGILGNPGTVVLFGGGTEPYDPFHGGRFTIGYWCDPCQHKGIEVSGFFLGQQSLSFVADSNQFPVLTRPFFNINQGQEDSEITAAPGIANGVLAVKAPSQLWGIEANFRCNFCWGCKWRVDGLAGFRYLDLDESVNINESLEVLVDDDFRDPGDRAVVFDDFSTRNQFSGGQIGLDIEWRQNRWFVNFRPKLALGCTHQTIDINGGQAITRVAGGTDTFVGGLLALPSNIGRFERNRFSVVPELGINLGYQVTDNLALYVGYTFLYWTNVVRPGDQIDRVLDINQIPNFRPPVTPAPQRRPVVPFKETNFWAQGMNLGLEYRY